jgi:hypothetical protein
MLTKVCRSSVVPASSWRNDLAFGVVVGLVLGVVSGVRNLKPPVPPFGPLAGLGTGLGTGLAVGIVFMLFSTRTWQASRPPPRSPHQAGIPAGRPNPLVLEGRNTP